MTEPAIQITGLGKRYRIGGPRAAYRTLRETVTAGAAGLAGRVRGRADADGRRDFWSLRDVSFAVRPGEVVGVIGRNGAGKSTLLKILSRITRPTEGRVVINGRVGSLLEVGTGFHPELTGRENVYLNGGILGMSRREVAAKFDEIVAFSEIEAFLDTPVKRYSSGMYVRLAFAVAAHLEPEILIVDEVLAVGDQGFQKKCVAKMQSVGRAGTTVLVVSHNLAVVEQLCTRAVLLAGGRRLADGPPAAVIREYLAEANESTASEFDLTATDRRAAGATPILTRLGVAADGRPGVTVAMGGRVAFELDYATAGRPVDLKVGVVIETDHGGRVVAFSPTFQCPDLLAAAPPAGTVRLDVPWLNLVEGDYWVNVYAQADGLADGIEHACRLRVTAVDVFATGKTLAGYIAETYLPSIWSVGRPAGGG